MEDEGVEDDFEDHPAEDQVVGFEALDDAPLVIDIPKEPPRRCTMDGFEDVRVHFDKFTHQSGHQRAMVKCKNHDRCRLDVFIKDFDSADHAAAFLMAWVMEGERFPNFNQKAQHTARRPGPDAVAAVLAGGVVTEE